MKLERLFLVKIYKLWPKLFWFSLIYIFGTISSFILTKSTITPFFVFSMYSGVIESTPVYETICIEINKKELNFYNLPKEHEDIIIINCKRLVYMQGHRYKDKLYDKLKNPFNKFKPVLNKLFDYKSINPADFKSWLQRYIEKSNDIKIKSIDIYRTKLKYNTDGKASIVSKALVL